MNWEAIAAISTGITALVLISGLFVALSQLRETSKSRKLRAFMDINPFLQQEEIRAARGVLIEMEKGKDFKRWSKEEKEAAEKVCMSFNLLGEMIPRFTDEDSAVPPRRDSIIKCWEAAEPMLTEYRRKRGKTFWSDFNRLYKMAKRLDTGENAT